MTGTETTQHPSKPEEASPATEKTGVSAHTTEHAGAQKEHYLSEIQKELSYYPKFLSFMEKADVLPFDKKIQMVRYLMLGCAGVIVFLIFASQMVGCYQGCATKKKASIEQVVSPNTLVSSETSK